MTAPQWCYVAVGEIMLGTGGDWSEANIDVFANHMANLEDRDAAEEAALVMVREWRSNRPVPWAVYLDAYRRARLYATSRDTTTNVGGPSTVDPAGAAVAMSNPFGITSGAPQKCRCSSRPLSARAL